MMSPPAPLTDTESQRLREALRTAARLLVIDLERRGVELRLSPAGTVQARPRHLLTDADRDDIQQHTDTVRVLLAYRAHWSAWPQPVPPFDPSKAFAEPTEAALEQRRPA